jgi:hypothetical protein
VHVGREEVAHQYVPSKGGLREVAFSEEEHRLLQSELKHLYTAVTRPRVNLWVFDQDRGRRDPVFHFLSGRNLCTAINSIECATDDGVELFAKTSSMEDWYKQVCSRDPDAHTCTCMHARAMHARADCVISFFCSTDALSGHVLPQQNKNC